MNFTLARIITAIMLYVALDRMPIGYYTILRFVVCGITAYGAYVFAEQNKKGWAWIFGIFAVLFNPFVPMHLSRNTWAPIDVGVAAFLLISIFGVKPQ